jgi:alanine dehydrogenase
VPLPEFLVDFDIVVNCVLQDTNAPQIYLSNHDVAAMAPGSLVVDVSCDRGMGFSWAQPTSFSEPVIPIGNGVRYYAVDHSPSLLWDSATWVISEAFLPFLDTVMAGPAAWERDETVRRAIEVRDGEIQNSDILSFQHRTSDYPHAIQSRR